MIRVPAQLPFYNRTRSEDGQDASHRQSAPLGWLVLLSVVFMLNLTAVFTLTTGMDMYGFFTFDSVAKRPLPMVLSTATNLFMAAVAYVSYGWLYHHRRRFSGGQWGPFTRGLVLSAVPVGLAFAPSVVFTSHGGKPTQIAIAGLIAGSLTVTQALRDPEAVVDAAVARHLVGGTIAVIIVFLALSVSGMLALYFTEQSPATGNLLWDWEYEWSELGYPREAFDQRQRDALAAFTLTGSGFMIVVLGGSMLGAILKWTHTPSGADYGARLHSLGSSTPEWITRVAQQLELTGDAVDESTRGVVVLGGREFYVTASQYERLVAGTDELLRDVELIVDKVAGDVFVRSGPTRVRLDFRVRSRSDGIRSGPFLLLSIYARHPGRRFTNGELRTMLLLELVDRTSVNVGDLIGQLQRRKPRLPIVRDDLGSMVPDSVRTCLFDLHDNPDSGLKLQG